MQAPSPGASPRTPDVMGPHRDRRRDSLKRKLREYSTVLGIATVSRLIVLTGILASSKILPPSNLSGWNEGTAWWRYLLRWDSFWYVAIMRGGYSYTPDSTIKQAVPFFPFYPGLSLAVARVLKIGAGPGALLVANCAALAALVLLYSYVRRRRNERIALAAVALLAVYPPSLYLSAGYPESLALLFAIACFLQLDREQPIRGSFWCGLLTATKPVGVVMLIPLAHRLWPGWRWNARAAGRLFLGFAIGCSGIIAYMTYLGVKFHAPVSFLTDQQAWVPHARWGSSQDALLALASFAAIFGAHPLSRKIDPWMYATFVALTIGLREQLQEGEFLYCCASLLFLALTRLGHGNAFTSMSRYLMLVFPVFIVAAEALDRRPLLRAAVLCVSAALLFWYSALFAQWYWVE